MARVKQTVIVKKTHPAARTRAAAARVARPFADRIGAPRETGTSFRFRQRPEACFAAGSYRTARPTPHVSVVYGEVKRSARRRKSCR